MTRISKYKLPQEKIEEIRNHFSHLVASLTNAKEIESFLDEFLTQEERLMLAKRLVLLMMIKRGYSPSLIQSVLHVSYESVRTYTNQLVNKSKLFQETIAALIKREKAKEFWAKVEKLLKPIDLALRSKNDMKARAKFASGDWS